MKPFVVYRIRSEILDLTPVWPSVLRARTKWMLIQTDWSIESSNKRWTSFPPKIFSIWRPFSSIWERKSKNYQIADVFVLKFRQLNENMKLRSIKSQHFLPFLNDEWKGSFYLPNNFWSFSNGWRIRQQSKIDQVLFTIYDVKRQKGRKQNYLSFNTAH